MKNFILFAALCCIASAITTVLIHMFPYQELTFDERAMLWEDSAYLTNRMIIIVHCLLFTVVSWGILMAIYKRTLVYSGLGFIFFALFALTEILRQLLQIFYLNGLREKYLNLDPSVSKEMIRMSIENFGFINYTIYTIFIISFGLGAIFYGIALLQLRTMSFNRWLGLLMLVWGVGSFIAFGNVFWGLNWLDKIIEPYNLYYQSLMRILIAIWLWRSYIGMFHAAKQINTN